MKATEVRRHLNSIPIGENQRIELTPGDTPRSLRNYFLVIAKLDGFVIRTHQFDDYIVVSMKEYNPENKKEKSKNIGVNGYYRRNNPMDFHWPSLRLSDLASNLEHAFRLDLTPRPIVGNDMRPPTYNRANKPIKEEE